MSYELQTKLEKQADRIELLEEELRSANDALAVTSKFAAGLQDDLENAIRQLQETFLLKRANP